MAGPHKGVGEAGMNHGQGVCEVHHGASGSTGTRVDLGCSRKVEMRVGSPVVVVRAGTHAASWVFPFAMSKSCYERLLHSDRKRWVLNVWAAET
jgi:hypothetical protein